MKKILQITTAIALTFTIAQSKAQVVTGAISADWTLTDINGVSHNLYTYLNAGKTVFIDISATWCSPCWAYHNSGAFDSVWTYHGPAGAPGVSGTTTDDCMVFFVEGDGATNTACLHGLTGCVDANNHNPTSQGDWTAGVTHPIIDPTSSTTPTVSAFDDIYNLAYFPTCVMICPDRSMTEVDQFKATSLYAAKAACSAATVAVDAEMITSLEYNKNLATCDSVSPTFRFANVGTSPLTSATITVDVDGTVQKTINWTGSLASYASTTVTGFKVGSSVSGAHTITATISNPNGSADPTSSNNTTTASFLFYPSVGGAFISESFETAGIPNDWAILNGGSNSWNYTTQFGFASTTCAYLEFYSIQQGQIDIMKLPPMSFAGSTTASLSFDVAYAQYAGTENDRLQVEVSTNCGTTWTSKYNKAGATLKTVPATTTEYTPAGDGDWRHENVNLNTVAGQSQVLVRFKGTSAYGNNLFIDNVNFSNADVSGVEENQMVNHINVYPNPMTNNAIVDFNLAEANKVSIVMVNTLGQVVLSEDLGKMNAGTQNYSLDAASLSNGLYFLNIKVGNNTVTKKVSINK